MDIAQGCEEAHADTILCGIVHHLLKGSTCTAEANLEGNAVWTRCKALGYSQRVGETVCRGLDDGDVEWLARLHGVLPPRLALEVLNGRVELCVDLPDTPLQGWHALGIGPGLDNLVRNGNGCLVLANMSESLPGAESLHVEEKHHVNALGGDEVQHSCKVEHSLGSDRSVLVLEAEVLNHTIPRKSCD